MAELQIKKTRSKKVAKAVVEEVAVPIEVPVPVIEVAEVTEEAEATEAEATEEQLSFSETIKSVLAGLAELKSQFKEIESNIRSARALYKDELKNTKSSKKRKPRVLDPNAPPKKYGFVKSCIISDALADFLGEANGSELARPDVTKRIWAYINEKECHGEKLNKAGEMARNRTIIVPDSKLKKLLGKPQFPLNKADPTVLGYCSFNLQSYLKAQGCFIPVVPAVTA